MPIPAAIVDELESALRAGSYARRVEVLHCVTDLFVNTAKNITAEQVAVFDDVICRLASGIESKALAELSRRLAPISNAPGGKFRRLLLRHRPVAARHACGGRRAPCADDRRKIGHSALSLPPAPHTRDRQSQAETACVHRGPEQGRHRAHPRGYFHSNEERDRK